MEWNQDIREAPKDCVILITDGHWVAAAIWDADNEKYPWLVFDPDVEENLNGWQKINSLNWMPLPKPNTVCLKCGYQNDPIKLSECQNCGPVPAGGPEE